ncbi:MAG TPA: glycogen/starch synthase [Saprospiraceae bacterium]|nr:glycogen/starch synthase [Saprospiraceae bacterium]
MGKKKLLFVTQEMNPFTTFSRISEVVNRLPQYTNENGFEIRVLMPRFGTINERRHRLHEVVRLSGMNIIVDDEDYPLIIKVASLPGARLQVYFLDNEEFFKRKFIFTDEEKQPFEDNMERMVFFCKGVMETVKKFGWPPDIIHCHGWMTSLVPFYIKTVYHNDPVFTHAKVIFSVYDDHYANIFDDRFLEVAAINNLEEKDLRIFLEEGRINLMKGALFHSDVIVKGSKTLNGSVTDYVSSGEVPVVDYQEDIQDLLTSHIELYNQITEE